MDKLSYSLGLMIAENLKEQGLKIENTDDFKAAFEAQMNDQATEFGLQEAQAFVNDYVTDMQARLFTEKMEQQRAFFEENGKKENVNTTESGLQYEVIEAGNGPKPTAEQTVTVHYHGTLLDGNVFDSSVERKEPATFPVNGVIQGWVEALQLMPTGAKYKLYIPSHLAYGERGAGRLIGPHTPLVFEVELIAIQ
ncbi:MAG: FKBP-type peptidyl-prolyl cis-trans isomerase [Hyphomicrobiales bacterium]